MAAARELNYHPHAHARAMVSGRHGAVGLLVGHGVDQSSLSESLLRAIMCCLSDRELSLVLANIPDVRLRDPDYMPRMIREYAVDGMLVNYTHGLPPGMVELVRQHVPSAVWLNSKQETNATYPDDFGAAAALTRKLIARGHRRIAYVNYSHGWRTIQEAHYSARDRQAGYEAVMREAGLSPVVYMQDQYVPAGECEQVSRRMLRSLRPTAVVAQSEKASVPLLFAARAMGMEAPRDLSVMSFMRPGRTRPLGMAMSGMVEPSLTLSHAAVEMVVQAIDRKESEVPSRVVPFDFDEGASVGDAP